MGLFSETETYVGTSVCRAIEDKNMPDSIKAGLFNALVSAGSIGENVLEELIAGIGYRAEKAYRYAKQSYPFGLPSSQSMQILMGDDEAEIVLGAIEGAPVVIDYCNLSRANILHYAWMKIVSDLGYNPETNELTVVSLQKGFPVYLTDLVPVIYTDVPDAANVSGIEYWGVSPLTGWTPRRVAVPPKSIPFSLLLVLPTSMSSGATEGCRAVICWDETSTEMVNGEEVIRHNIKDADINLPFVGLYDIMADYLHVKYSVGGATKYWSYLIGSGVYPLLDGLLDQPPQTVGEYFPFIYFRHNKTPIGDNKNSDVYKACKKMSKIIGMNYDQVHDAIHKNPDIANVEQAVLMFAVPMSTENPLETQYLFDYFRKLYFAQPKQFQFASSVPLLDFENDRDRTMRNAIVIQDQQFKMALRHDGIFKKLVAGVIGSMGTITKSYRETKQKYLSRDDYGTEYVNYRKSSVYTIRKQISSSMYEELEIHGLNTVFRVFNQYETIGKGTDPIFLVPIDRAITKNYPIRERETIYARGMHYVFNSRVTVKLKWYESSFFQFILVVVSVVLVVVTYGQSLQALASGLAAGGTAATIAIMAFLKQILIGVMVQQGFRIFVKEIGLEAAFLIAIAAALAGAYQFISQGGVAGAPWVEQLVQLSSGMSSGINSVSKDLIGDLLGEYENFLLDSKEQAEALDQARSLLDQKTWISPFVVFGETPNEFFNRTVHSGNIGAMSIEAVTNYVQVALSLPKTAETLGDSHYG